MFSTQTSPIVCRENLNLCTCTVFKIYCSRYELEKYFFVLFVIFIYLYFESNYIAKFCR